MPAISEPTSRGKRLSWRLWPSGRGRARAEAAAENRPERPAWRPRGRGLALRIAGVVGILLLIMMMAAMALAVWSHQIRDRNVSMARGQALAQLVAEAPSAYRANIVFSGVRAFPEASVAILDRSGAALTRAGADSDYPRPDVALAAVAAAQSKKGGPVHQPGGLVDYVIPLKSAATNPGAPYLVVARVPAVGVGWYGPAVATAILLVGALLSILGYWASAAFARRITRPLREIAEAAANVSTRRLAVSIDVNTGDEVEAVALAFNRMTRRLEAGMERVRRASSVDPVTDLPNRQRFLREVTQLLGRRSPGDPAGAVILCDLARFRQLNEAVGRTVADEVLAIAAERFADAMKAEDAAQRNGLGAERPCVLARLGADEFGVFAPFAADAETVTRIMQALIDAIRAPVEISGQRLFLSGSAGGVLCGPDSQDPEQLIACAQAALNHARAEGFGRYRLFASGMERRARNAFAAETALREAIEKQLIVPYFQPKVDLTSGKITSAEALARWVIPDRGVIEPRRFIPAAEKLGLMNALGESMLRQACQAASDWSKQGLRCRVAVNVAPVQFENENFSRIVFGILGDTGLAPDLLELEITESTAMRDPASAARRIAPLREAGVRLALDDFGAGHSSLAMLTQLPFDVFKIDRQFVSGLDTDEQAAAVVDTILTLARSLNFETVAEGIETVRQEAFLRKRGCTLGQGFFYGRPVPLTEFLQMATAGRRRSGLSVAS